MFWVSYNKKVFKKYLYIVLTSVTKFNLHPEVRVRHCLYNSQNIKTL